MTCYSELLSPWWLPRPAVEIESLSRGREAGAVHRASSQGHAQEPVAAKGEMLAPELGWLLALGQP